MRVKDLLAKLRELPADMEVVIDDPEGELRQIKGAVAEHEYLGTGVVWLESKPLDLADVISKPRRTVEAKSAKAVIGDCPECGSAWIYADDDIYRAACSHLSHYDPSAGVWVMN